MTDAVVRDTMPVMGTVFSFALCDPGGRWPAARQRYVSWLRRVDAMFSTFRPNSYICRMAHHEVDLADAPHELREVHDLCRGIEQDTLGYFAPYRHGHFDPTGVVKGWAVERVSRMLTADGFARHLVNGAGDIQLACGPNPGEIWRVGVAHPLRPTALVAVVSGENMAIATSGNAEQGAHIIDPHTEAPANSLASVTLTGPSVSLLDGYATAAFAMGRHALHWIKERPDLEACLVAHDGVAMYTAGFPGTGE